MVEATMHGVMNALERFHSTNYDACPASAAFIRQQFERSLAR